MAEAKKRIKKRKKRRKLSPEQKEKNAYRSEVRAIFNKSGFNRVPGVSDKEFTFKDATSDFDDVFIHENIIVFLEYTLTQSSKLSDHLKPKKILYDLIMDSPQEFLQFYEEKFPSFKESKSGMYDNDQCRVVILYCPKNTISPKYKKIIDRIKYLEYPALKYFKSVSNTIRLSSRSEIFSFLGFNFSDIGENVLSTSAESHKYPGSLLPHSHSNFDKGFKVVSFYVDPASLLERSYVLRKDGWRDDIGLYQRMIVPGKINAIRKYLNTEKRVFINNIIVTLPSETKIINKSGDTVDSSTIIKTTPVQIQIPNGFNVIGLIDGQHRVFAYHEGGVFEDDIAKLRKRQNLLVTGIIYPEKISNVEKRKFEAKLFLEINSNQTNAKSDLKQEISLLLNPFSAESIAKSVVNSLNNAGPLEDKFERHFYDKGKIKTTSIVSYGLKPIVKLSGSDSLFSMWDNPNKENILNESDDIIRDDYRDFCVEEINKFLLEVKLSIYNNGYWTTDKEVKRKVLTTTAINGFIVCLRQIIEVNQKLFSSTYYKTKLKDLKDFKFEDYKSSQYGRMGRDLFDTYFRE